MKTNTQFRIYTAPGCPACAEVKAVMDSARVAFEEVQIQDDPIAAGGIAALAGEVKIPVVVYFPSKQVFLGLPEPLRKIIEKHSGKKLRDRGLGDTIRRITSFFGIKSCQACIRRADALNRWVPYKEKENVQA